MNEFRCRENSRWGKNLDRMILRKKPQLYYKIQSSVKKNNTAGSVICMYLSY